MEEGNFFYSAAPIQKVTVSILDLEATPREVKKEGKQRDRPCKGTDVGEFHVVRDLQAQWQGSQR